MARTRIGQGQTALVTGASTGIGVDLAECFAKDGYDLILCARTEPALRAVAERLAAAHKVKATSIACDLGEPGAGTRLAAEIAARGLSVDVLVNNAGLGHAGAFTGSDTETQVGMVDLNDRVLVELTHIYWAKMIAAKRGGVLNVASLGAFPPGPLMAVYYASKAFVLSFSEALWEEGRAEGVHVSCLCPGATESKFRDRAGTGATRLAEGKVMSSKVVARQGYNAFRKNQRVMITGAKNYMLAKLVPFLPRTTVLKMVRNLQSPPS